MTNFFKQQETDLDVALVITKPVFIDNPKYVNASNRLKEIKQSFRDRNLFLVNHEMEYLEFLLKKTPKTIEVVPKGGKP